MASAALGATFACEYYGIQPDILVVSKQITSSYMPLAAVLMSDKIYQGVADGSDALGTFGHGFTTSGHPVATAVGVENLKILEERNLVANAKKVGAHMQARLREFADHPLVGEVRGVGLIGAVELVADKASKAKFDPPGKVGLYLYDRGHENGVIVRAIGDIDLLLSASDHNRGASGRYDRALCALSRAHDGLGRSRHARRMT